MSTVKLPDNMKNIGSDAFTGCYNLTKVELPKNLKQIGWSGFERSGITELTIPEKVEYISSRAFFDCTNLKTVDFSNAKNLSGIGSRAFGNCTGLESISWPEGVKYIDTEMFAGCYNLKTITIPESVNRIWNRAFEYCVALENVDLPDDLTWIGSRAFYGSGLKSIELPAGLKELRPQTFAGTNIEAVTIPDTIREIGYSAFEDCYNLTSVTLPTQLETIGNAAFQRCGSLETIEIPDSVTFIANRAFEETKLSAVKLPTNLNNLGARAFYNTPLTAINIPESIDYIQPETFAGTELTEVTLPDNIREIGYSAFEDCKNLTSINLKNVADIGDWAFYGADSLKAVTIPANGGWIGYRAFYIPKLKVTFDGKIIPYMNGAFASSAKIKADCDAAELYRIISEYDVFLNHNYSGDTCSVCSSTKGSLIPSYWNSNVVKYEIGEGQYLEFDKESGLITGVSYFDAPVTALNIPEKIDGVDVTGIGYRAFYEEDALTSITLNAGANYIGGQAFQGTGITKITIPENVTSIPTSAFRYTEIEEIKMPITAEFTGSTELTELTKFTFTKGIGGAVDYTDSSYKTQPWYKNRARNSLSIKFVDGVEKIGDYAFANLGIVRYTIPASVKEIGDYAFYRNKDAAEFTLSEGLEKIGYGAFAECEELATITLPASLSKMKSNSFEGCDDLVATVYDGTYGKTAAKKFGIAYKIESAEEIVVPDDKPVAGVVGEVKLGTTYGLVGKTVEVPIIVTSNPGIASLQLTVSYNTDALTLTGISDTGDFDKSVFGRQSDVASSTLLWKTADNMKTNVSTTGTLATLQFKINENAACEDYEITLASNDGDTIMADGTKVTMECTNGRVKVTDFVYGDVNTSGSVDINDVDYLTKKIAGWDAYQKVNEKASDVDINGKVNMRDVAILSRYVAGWTGYEKLPNTQDPLPLAQ